MTEFSTKNPPPQTYSTLDLVEVSDQPVLNFLKLAKKKEKKTLKEEKQNPPFEMDHTHFKRHAFFCNQFF